MYQEVGTFGTFLGHENRAYEQDKHFINEIVENYLAPSTVKGQREDEPMSKCSPTQNVNKLDLVFLSLQTSENQMPKVYKPPQYS